MGLVWTGVTTVSGADWASLERSLALLGLLGDSLGRGLITVRGLWSSASLMDWSSPGLRAATGEVMLWLREVELLVLGVTATAGDSRDFSLMETTSLSNSFSAWDF